MSAAYLSSPISPLTAGMGHMALLSENTDDVNSNSRPSSDSDVIEVRPIGESWESWGDGDVLRTVLHMLATLASRQDRGGSVTKGSEPTRTLVLRAPKSKQRRSSNERRQSDVQAVYNRSAHILSFLSWSMANDFSKGYFVVFPCIYFIDQERIIYRLDEYFQHHRVISLPLQPCTPFNLHGVSYWVDSRGELGYQLGHDWVKEVFYTDLKQALSEVKRCIENNNLQSTTQALWIHTTSSDDSLGNASSGPSSPALSVRSDESHSLPLLSQCPDQSEIDNWFQQLKRCRAIQAKSGQRLQEVRCPLGTCAKVQRRPQALRDHLYFHFGIKPYKCQFGCQQAFETKANMERHTDTCPIRWGTQ
ncbi:unnamed protein product [Rhizoctonia solani]|uniref:C2H2-type domain-containing protein n=1 Tax=Rhizoctonia solani TaxID=456999 RepID=A0A8H3ALA2_9AGAM|nr:unnamed protein product [Rhizoctonia solani]CAE7091545.1 unnamed protein product [Rhizoctonia solani]